MVATSWAFSEREFYLAEFRGRTLGIALAQAPSESTENLASVISELAKNGTRCVVLSPVRALLDEVAGVVVELDAESGWIGEIWRGLRDGMCVGLFISEGSTGNEGPGAFAAQCRAAVLALRLAKLVWVDGRGSLRDAAGQRISLLDLSDLSDLSGEGRSPALDSQIDRALVEEFRCLLEGGIASVNICSQAGLADELFTYAGSGTLLTQNRYLDVRPLGVDDFDAATDLIARGVDEGFLAPRSEAEVEAALGRAFGVFVEGRYLAGIGALIGYETERVAEIVSLYTVTRFAGEGVGGHLVSFALELGRAAGYAQVFACTTSSRVERFFLRQGFESVAQADVPESKWADYPPERRDQARCLVRALD